jgi:acid stress-induced BolA-like protein IbaG/YrbA
MHPTATSNEDFLAEFRDWCSQHKLSSTDIEYQVSYVSELGDFMAPVPLSQVTKAVLYDFFQEQHIHARSRESHKNIMRAAISLDAFRADKRRKKTNS